MASEQVLEVLVRRHVIHSEQPFSSLTKQAQGNIGLMRFLQLDADTGLTLDPRYHDAAASQVAERLDTEVLGLLRQATRVPASAPA